MNDDTNDSGNHDGPKRFSLSRWSERKRAVARGEAVAEAPPVPIGDAKTARGVAGVAVAGADAAAAAPEIALPHVDSLTFDSDFTVFMTGKVDESVKRAALRTLLHDPRFNVMDGLDVYIDDYSIPSPMSPDILAQLRHSIDVLNPVFPPGFVPAPVAINDAPAASNGQIAETAAPSGGEPPAALESAVPDLAAPDLAVADAAADLAAANLAAAEPAATEPASASAVAEDRAGKT
jgi:uncharacterized protein DUF3306